MKKNHNRIRIYKCIICDKSFGQLNDMKEHRINSHSKPTKKDMLSEVETKYKCDICEQCFKYLHHLKNHIKRHSGERRFQCNTCDIRFPTNSALMGHTKIHDRSNAKNHFRVDSRKKQQCKFCDKWYKKIKEHEKTHSGIKSFQCKFCAANFSSTSGFGHHMAVAHGKLSRIYKCDKCQYTSLSNTGLKSHTKNVLLQSPRKFTNKVFSNITK